MKKCFWNVSKWNIRSVGKQAETSPVQMLGYMVIINTTTDGSFNFSSLTCWRKRTQWKLILKKQMKVSLNLGLCDCGMLHFSTSRKRLVLEDENETLQVVNFLFCYKVLEIL